MSFSDTLAKAVLSTSSDAVIAADKEGIIRFWNPGAERILGYARDVAVGQSLDIIIPERLRKRHWDGYHGVMKSGESRYGHGDVLAVPAIKKDGVEVSIEFTIVPLRDGAGELAGLVAILRDVTKRFEEMRALKRKLAEATKLSRCGEHDGVERTLHTAVQDRSSAEQRARTSQKLVALGEMTGGVAHDFRNLLAAIDSGLRLAEKNSEGSEKVRVYIAAARQAINRGVKLTSQLLAFAKRQELGAHAADVNKILRNLELLLKYSVGPETRIAFELASDIPKCLIDPSQFDAAVLNLVVNARDAMPRGGEVRISTERCIVETTIPGSPPPGTYIRVCVKDSGEGIPTETIRKIFDPFFTTKGERGNGLGLPRVCAFMRRIGGHVSVTSERGRGTTFDLLFPSIGPGGPVALPPLNADLGLESVLSHDRSR
jgi:PAS domain S-box-containing protein